MTELMPRMAFGLAIFLPFGAWGALLVDSIDFKVNGDSSEILVKANQEFAFSHRENKTDRQIILDIEEAKLGPMASRKFDTSSFNSPVSLISPYLIGDDGETVRVVIQLSQSAPFSVSRQGSGAKIVVGPSASGSASASSNSPAVPDSETAETSTSETNTPLQTKAPSPAIEKDQAAKDNLAQFLESRKTQNFKGSPITLQVRDAEVQDVLRLISEASGFNIILGPAVVGKLTLSLIDVPWDQALDVILHTLKLGAERNHNVLRILTLANLTSEKQQQLAAKQAAEATAPQITRVFPISYANITELRTVLTAFRKSSATGLVSGTIDIDNRTNSIIVQDIEDNLRRIEKLIQILDTQTPQVLVEAKIVEATEGSSFSMGGGLGFRGGGRQVDPYFASFGGANPIDFLISFDDTDDSSQGIFTGSSIAGAGSGGTFGAQPQLSFLPGPEKLTAVLQLEESENKVKVVSSPRTVVLNKERASILQSIPVLIETQVIAETGNFIPTNSIQDANISLDVTPSVTNDENVLLDLNISRDVPVSVSAGESGIGRRNLTTKVLVEGGSTLVIGGIYVSDKTELSAGFPVLKDIPIVGTFFGTRNKSTTRSELFIFVTPKILNVKKAGLSGGRG